MTGGDDVDVDENEGSCERAVGEVAPYFDCHHEQERPGVTVGTEVKERADERVQQPVDVAAALVEAEAEAEAAVEVEAGILLPVLAQVEEPLSVFEPLKKLEQRLPSMLPYLLLPSLPKVSENHVQSILPQLLMSPPA